MLLPLLLLPSLLYSGTFEQPHDQTLSLYPNPKWENFLFQGSPIGQKKKKNSHQLYSYKCENVYAQQESSKQILGHRGFVRTNSGQTHPRTPVLKHAALLFLGGFCEGWSTWSSGLGNNQNYSWLNWNCSCLVLRTVKTEIGRNSKFTILI